MFADFPPSSSVTGRRSSPHAAAILVRTAIGQLQLRRTLKGIARRMTVFTDEAEALAHLAAPSRR